MTVHQTPAPARSDVRTPFADASVDRRSRPYRREGMLLTAGALAWAASQVVTGVDAEQSDGLSWLFGVGSGLFQLGLLGLLTVLHRTKALGAGRLARAVIRIELALVLVAIGSTVSDTIGTTDFDKVGFLLMDMCWPLSMLGMFAIGIRIAIAGRWKGAARFWPMLAESWAVVCLPVMAIFGVGPATVVSIVHLTLGYGVLGQLVARKEG